MDARLRGHDEDFLPTSIAETFPLGAVSKRVSSWLQFRISFQLDEHVPGAIASGLRRRGIEVVTAAESGVLGALDAEVLATAHAAGRVLVTHWEE